MTSCHSIMFVVRGGDKMPNKAFGNLSSNKKRKLEQAALEEFSRYTYDQISINRIIQAIDMPRGSFYLYFNDKEDLYLYIFSKYHKILLDFILDVVKDNDDIIVTYQVLFDKIIEYSQNGHQKNLLKNFFIGLNHNIENKAVKSLTCEQNNIDLFNIILDKISSKYKDQDSVLDIIDILTNVLVHSLTGYYILNLDLNFVKKRFNNQLSIIRRGILK